MANLILRSTLLSCSLAGVLGCSELTSESSESGSGSNQPPTPGEHEAIGWRRISASSGGTVDIPDGARLVVPPGALSKDTLITVRIPNPPSYTEREYKLEPSGLVFDKPAYLHIPYTDLPNGKPPLFTVFQASESNPIVDAGSEQTNWQYAEPEAWDDENDELVLRVEHFSWIYGLVNVDQDAYVVLDIPFKYLQPGDALFALTEAKFPLTEATGPNWNPGHAGMLEVVPGAYADTAQVIEPTPPRVRRAPATNFTLGNSHLYMGARRPPENIVMTREDRENIMKFLTQQLGKPYHVFTQGNVDNDSFSCVGLVEAALDSVGDGALSPRNEAQLATPLGLFRATRPVTELSEHPEVEIQVPIYGVVADPKSAVIARTFRGHYTKTEAYTLEWSNLPSGAEFVANPSGGHIFKWKPTVEHVCTSTAAVGVPDSCPAKGMTYLINVKLTAYPYGFLTPVIYENVVVEEQLAVNVTGHARVHELNAVPVGSKEFTMGVQAAAGSLIHDVKFEDLTTPKIPGVSVMLISLTQNGTSYTALYSVDNTTGAVVNSPVKIRLWVDYSPDVWRNDGG